MENTNSNYSEVFEDGELKQYVVLKPVKRKRSITEEEVAVDLNPATNNAPDDSLNTPQPTKATVAKEDVRLDKMMIHLKSYTDVTKLYQKIKVEEGCTVSGPADVFDFYDEEDERKKREEKEKKEKIKDLKARTCIKCGKVFPDPIQNLIHKREAHRTEKIYITSEKLNTYLAEGPKKNCPVCKEKITKFQHKSAYISHLETHSLNRYTCKTCNMKFTRFDNLKVHEKRHIV